MGNYIVKKGILLDEKDFSISVRATLDDIAEVVNNYLDYQFGNPDPEMANMPPWLEIDGLVSERLDAAQTYADRFNWVWPSEGFKAALLREHSRLAPPSCIQVMANIMILTQNIPDKGYENVP